MRINEAEELLGISKANIRFYEKQGLLTPQRGENRYRDYTDGDIDRLRQIVILRKLGISVQDIGKILGGELLLQEAITANIASLEEQIEQLTGALKLSKQIRSEELTELDTPRYWEIIHREESNGVKFADMMSDYWKTMMEPIFRILFVTRGTGSLPSLFGQALLFVLFITVMDLVFFPEDFTPRSILDYPKLFLSLYVGCLPYYLLQRKFSCITSFFLTILLWSVTAIAFLFIAFR